MAVTAGIAVYTGSDLSTSSLHTGVAMLSGDYSASESGSRSGRPVGACSQSFTKWMKLYFSASAASTIDAVEVYGDGAVDASTSLFCGTTCSASPPSMNNSGIATDNVDQYVTGGRLAWDSGSYSAVGSIDTYLVLQLDANASASLQDWGQETLTVAWNEGAAASTLTFTVDAKISKRFRRRF